MPNGSSSHIPIQRLTDIQDEQLRECAAQGIQITLHGNLAHLRSIKDTEHKWVDLFSIVTRRQRSDRGIYEQQSRSARD